MKMVAAAKYARAERQLKPARVYGTGALGMYAIYWAGCGSGVELSFPNHGIVRVC